MGSKAEKWDCHLPPRVFSREAYLGEPGEPTGELPRFFLLGACHAVDQRFTSDDFKSFFLASATSIGPSMS